MVASGSRSEEVAKMFEEIWPRLRDDIGVIRDELMEKGYKVLTIFPRQVSLSQVGGKFGFVITIPYEKTKDLMDLLGSGLRYTVDVEFGLHKELAVFVIILRNLALKRAILYYAYYHTSAEWLIKDKGRKGFYTFFLTAGGSVAGWVDLGNHEAFLYTRYLKRK